MTSAKVKPFLFKLLPLVFLAIIFLVRVYRMDNIQFDSDFGRDSLFAWRILHEKPTLLGAQASVGGFYLGPLYFYSLSVIYAVFGPVPQIVMLWFAVLNMVAAYLGFRLLRRASFASGLIFLVLFSTQPLLVAASRGATHVPMLPFVTILSIYALVWALETKKVVAFLFSGIAFGLFFHVHFSALLLLPGFLLVTVIYSGQNMAQRSRALAVQILGMILMLSPLILFDLRHDFITSRAFFEYLSSAAKGGEIRNNFPHWDIARKTQEIFIYLAPYGKNKSVVILALTLGLIGLVSKKTRELTPRVLLILTSTVIALLFLYKGYLFAYYLVVPGTLLILVSSLLLSQIPIRVLGFAIAMYFFIAWLPSSNMLYVGQFRTLQNLEKVTGLIESHARKHGNQVFNVYKDSSDGLTGLAYEYRFLVARDGFVVESEYAYEKTRVLYLIREEGNSDPLTLGGYEMSQFNAKKKEDVGSLFLLDRKVDVFALYK